MGLKLFDANLGDTVVCKFFTGGVLDMLNRFFLSAEALGVADRLCRYNAGLNRSGFLSSEGFWNPVLARLFSIRLAVLLVGMVFSVALSLGVLTDFLAESILL